MSLEPIPEDHEYKIAIRLLDQDPPLDRQILEELVGGPKKNRELRPLLGTRNVNVLTKALARLRAEGVIRMGYTSDLRERTYALTKLGTLVIFLLHEMIPYHRSEAAVARARGSVEA